MSRLTKAKALLHEQACDLVAAGRPLTEEEKWFVLEHWSETSEVDTKLTGAFFTPLGLAGDMSINVSGDRVIDLCAGTGRLAFLCRDLWGRWPAGSRELVCVERNAAYVEVGRRVLPHAEWICADITEVPGMDLGSFDCAIANPPFGFLPAGAAPRYCGSLMHFVVIDIAADLARRGVFLLPQPSSPFQYSGRDLYSTDPSPPYERFHADTGITLEMRLSIDTAYYDGDWNDVSPRTEVVCADFTERAIPANHARPREYAHPDRRGRTRTPVHLAVPVPARPARSRRRPEPGQQAMFDL